MGTNVKSEGCGQRAVQQRLDGAVVLAKALVIGLHGRKDKIISTPHEQEEEGDYATHIFWLIKGVNERG